MQAVETYKKHGLTVNIYHDEDTPNPREDDDNLGMMVCQHRRYDLGDKDCMAQEARWLLENAGSWEEAEQAIEKEFGPSIILPLYLYDHSGITIRTRPFSCDWDSGRVGLIFATLKNAREEYGRQGTEEKVRAYAERVLRQEVGTYDQYLTGDVYGYEVTGTNADGVEVDDSCWGCYGREYVNEAACDAAESLKGAQLALTLEDTA